MSWDRLEPAGADRAVSVLLRVSEATERALAVLDGDPSTPQWFGPAAREYGSARDRLSWRLEDIADVVGRAAFAVAAYARVLHQVADDRSWVGAAQRRLEQEQQLAIAMGAWTTDYETRAGHLATVRREGEERLQLASRVAAQQLHELRELVRQRPLDAGDQLAQAGQGFADGLVLGPARAVWALTGAAVTDHDTWEATVKALVGTALKGAVNPVGALVGVARSEWDEYSQLAKDGRYGAMGGGLAAAGVGLPKKAALGGVEQAAKQAAQKAAVDAAEKAAVQEAARLAALAAAEAPVKAALGPEWQRYMAPADAPLPTMQSVDEMIAGIVLAQHEHRSLGHAIRRHVAAANAYLERRLTEGTLLDDGTLDNRPVGAASTWNDVETAEHEITRILKAKEQMVRDFAAGSNNKLELNEPVPADVGRVLKCDGEDFDTSAPTKARLVLGRTPAGDLYLETAYLY